LAITRSGAYPYSGEALAHSETSFTMFAIQLPIGTMMMDFQKNPVPIILQFLAQYLKGD
jgi:hypothetical protein